MQNLAEGSGGIARLPGVQIAYDRVGRGAPVVLLHGGLLDRQMWDPQIADPARGRAVIRYDMRGAGESLAEPTAEPFAHHEDLRGLLDALDIQRASLVGLSNNAVALDFALAYPERTDRLALVSPGLRGYAFTDPWVEAGFAAMLAALGRRDLAGAVEAFLKLWVDGPSRAAEDVDPLVRAKVAEMVERNLRASRLAPNVAGLEPPAAGRLAEVRAPTLVVLGALDAPDIHAIGRLIHAGIAGSQLVTIPGAGHTLPMEQPAALAHLLAAFLPVAQ